MTNHARAGCRDLVAQDQATATTDADNPAAPMTRLKRRADDSVWREGPAFLNSDRPLARYVGRPIAEFLRVEAAGGVLLLLAAVLAMAWANSPWSDSYVAFWHTEIGLRIGAFELSEDLQHWVNDALMVIFFFVVGLEIKYEVVAGHLRDLKAPRCPSSRPSAEWPCRRSSTSWSRATPRARTAGASRWPPTSPSRVGVLGLLVGGSRRSPGLPAHPGGGRRHRRDHRDRRLLHRRSLARLADGGRRDPAGHRAAAPAARVGAPGLPASSARSPGSRPTSPACTQRSPGVVLGLLAPATSAAPGERGPGLRTHAPWRTTSSGHRGGHPAPVPAAGVPASGGPAPERAAPVQQLRGAPGLRAGQRGHRPGRRGDRQLPGFSRHARRGGRSAASARWSASRPPPGPSSGSGSAGSRTGPPGRS